MTNSGFLDEPRFQQPADWRWHHFKSLSGHKIRFGSVYPKGKIPDAVVICLPGFREFAEKYYETAHDMLNRNYGFWIMDWAGQGMSDRYLSDPYKVHSLGIGQHVQDLKSFIFDYVKPAAVHPDVGRLPVVFLGHSMGAHIGLRYLHDNKENFIRAAAFSAPLVRITQFAAYPPLITEFLCEILRMFPTSYVPGGEQAAETLREAAPGTGFYSSDSVRDQLHKAWFDAMPALQVKGPTYRWLYELIRSCNILEKKSYLADVRIPVLIATAGKDKVVSSKAAAKLAAQLPNCELVDFPEANHEILMERDHIRNRFLNVFDDFMKRHILTRDDRLIKF